MDDVPVSAAGPQRGLLGRVLARWHRIDALLYVIYVVTCVGYVASRFYSYMLFQTGGEWSAPLDDVFIHFDYARATARGYPFEWSEGNGYSSGNTSLAYPFALALGYWVKFRGLDLMRWAAIVAVLCVVLFLLACGRLTAPLGRWAKYLLPPAVLSMGALDWSLWSGMENAFHLGVWALVLLATLRLRDQALEGSTKLVRWGWLAGAAGALLFATRPESGVCVAAFAFFAAYYVWRNVGGRAAIATVVRVGLPGAAVMVLQHAANRMFTGEWSANGAIAKLALNNPYMTSDEKWDQYLFLLKYVVVRNTEYHFSDEKPYGWLVLVVAAIPFAVRQLRPYAILLWVQVAGWLLLISLNGQVRWQNERYTMAAVAWVMVLAGMGIAALLSKLGQTRRARAVWFARAGAAVALVVVYWQHQAPRMQDQIWFFGRASRNIRDQQYTAGKWLAKLGPRRVLVGDAGALLYASDRPGLDLIGLGGYHKYPFARAGAHGLGASIELIEHMRPRDRPDLMALYPTWWGDLPVLFGRRIGSVPVTGNVICGGAEKVIYEADWGPLEHRSRPRSMQGGERIVDELDVANLLSERAHDYQFPRPNMGFVTMRVLEDPQEPDEGLFDAGRVIPAEQIESATMKLPTNGGRLIVRTVIHGPARVEVRIDERHVGTLELIPEDGWIEPSIELPPGLPSEGRLTLRPVGGGWDDHHVWIVEGP